MLLPRQLWATGVKDVRCDNCLVHQAAHSRALRWCRKCTRADVAPEGVGDVPDYSVVAAAASGPGPSGRRLAAPVCIWCGSQPPLLDSIGMGVFCSDTCARAVMMRATGAGVVLVGKGLERPDVALAPHRPTPVAADEKGDENLTAGASSVDDKVKGKGAVPAVDAAAAAEEEEDSDLDECQVVLGFDANRRTWEVFGGLLDSCDGTLVGAAQGAVRELCEELGIPNNPEMVQQLQEIVCRDAVPIVLLRFSERDDVRPATTSPLDNRCRELRFCYVNFVLHIHNSPAAQTPRNACAVAAQWLTGGGGPRHQRDGRVLRRPAARSELYWYSSSSSRRAQQ